MAAWQQHWDRVHQLGKATQRWRRLLAISLTAASLTCASAVAASEPAPGRLREASNLLLQVELSWDAVNDLSLIHISEPTRP